MGESNERPVRNVQWWLENTDDDDRHRTLEDIAARIFRVSSVRLDTIREVEVDRAGRGALFVSIDNRVYHFDPVKGNITQVIEV